MLLYLCQYFYQKKKVIDIPRNIGFFQQFLVGRKNRKNMADNYLKHDLITLHLFTKSIEKGYLFCKQKSPFFTL